MYSDHEITPWIDRKEQELRRLRRNWDDLRMEAPEKVNRLVREGFSTSASSYGSSNSVGMGLSFGYDTSAAEAYIAELRDVEFPKYFNAIAEAAIQIDKKLEEAKQEGNSAAMNKLVNHLFDWIDFGENLTIEIQGTIRLTVNGLDHFKNKWSSYRGSAYSYTPVTSSAPAAPKMPATPPKPARPVSPLRASTQEQKHAVWEVMAKPVLAIREQKLREILSPLQAELDQASKAEYERISDPLCKKQKELTENRENTQAQLDSLSAIHFRQKAVLRASIDAATLELASLQRQLDRAKSNYDYALKCNRAAIEEEQEALIDALEQLYPLPEEPGLQAPKEESKPRPTAVQVANEGYKDAIIEGMRRGRNYTCEEINKEIPEVTMLSYAKVMALVAQLKHEGRLSRVTEKGKAYFRIPGTAAASEKKLSESEIDVECLKCDILAAMEPNRSYTISEIENNLNANDPSYTTSFAKLNNTVINLRRDGYLDSESIAGRSYFHLTDGWNMPEKPPRPTPTLRKANLNYRAAIRNGIAEARDYTAEELQQAIPELLGVPFPRIYVQLKYLVNVKFLVQSTKGGTVTYRKAGPAEGRKPTAVQLANEIYKADILKELDNDRAYTVEEINKTVSSAQFLSFAKVNSLVQQLVDEDKMSRVEVKGKTLFVKV